ncbi:MAG: hypothetical protein CUN57_04130, partial [Phototrophicales bacterium]
PENPFPQLLPHGCLYHQYRTYEALLENDLVINTYNTGTGKTKAALLYLAELDRIYRDANGKKRQNVLFIAPTNELIRQHFEDVKAFTQDLNF